MRPAVASGLSTFSGRRAGRGGGRVQVTGAVPADVAGAAGDDDQDGGLVEPFGERGEPAQGLLVGPVGVVDEQDQGPLPAGEPAHGGHQAVAHALRVGLPLTGVGYAEGGPGDAVPVAEVLARLLGEHGHQGGLEQLAYDVEGDGPQGLAAARRPDGAAPGLGDAAGLGEQRGLAESGLAPGHQQGAGEVRSAHRVSTARVRVAISSSRSQREAEGPAVRPASVIPLPPQVARTTYRARAYPAGSPCGGRSADRLP